MARSGCRTAKVKVAERGQAEAEDIERVEAVRAALGPDGRIRVDANGAWEPGQAARMLRRAGPVRARVRRAALRHPGRDGRAASAYRYPGRRRRVDPPGRGPAAGARRGRGRHRDAEGPAARRGPRGAGGGGGLRPSGRGVERRGHLGRAGRRGGAGRRAPRAALRLRAGHHVAAGRGRDGRPAGARGGIAAGPPPGRRPGRAGPLGDRPGPVAGTGRGGRRVPPCAPLARGRRGREPLHRVRRRVQRRADQMRAARGGAGARVAQHAAGDGVLRGRAAAAGCGCTSGSTSAPPRSPRSAWPRPAAARWRCCAPRARRRPTSTRR